uniref:Uncharacterized protein n=1 Tax=Panagrolaimus sp. JU765 TaxID=591449 RepID=A0AC34QFA7_9BILA
MKVPTAPPLLPPEYPPPAYPGVAPEAPKKHKICFTLVDARKAAFVLSCCGIGFSFILFFLIFFEAIAFIVVCLLSAFILFFLIFFEAIAFIVVCMLSAYAYYNKNAFLYLPHICFFLLNCFLLVGLTILAFVAIFAPELASAYIPYLPDILKEWYRYFAIFVLLFCVMTTAFTLQNDSETPKTRTSRGSAQRLTLREPQNAKPLEKLISTRLKHKLKGCEPVFLFF